MEHIVEFKDISKSYAGVQVLSDIKLEVNRSDFMVIYGIPSSGKSVLMRLLVGLERPDSGRIILRGTDVSKKRPKKEILAMSPKISLYIPTKIFMKTSPIHFD